MWALVGALELSKDKQANIYTDSLYAFAILHIHRAIYKERGLLIVGEEGIENQNEILKLLEVIWEPKEAAVIHCKGHRKGKDSVSAGNHRADMQLNKLQDNKKHHPKSGPRTTQTLKIYSSGRGMGAARGKNYDQGMKVDTTRPQIYVPEQLAHQLVFQQHEITHQGKNAVETLLSQYYLIA